jgi:radical SAM protein with 4Fe4S-binding SPASM domain
VERITRALRDGVAALPELPGERMTTHLKERLTVLSHHRASMVLKAELHAPALVADVELTRRCDLACPQCFVRAQEDAGAQLPWELLAPLLEELSGYDTTLHLTGGEPFTHPDVWRVLEGAAELGLRRAVINTHAASLEDAGLVRLGSLAIPVKLLVSLDGPPGVHDRTRGARVTQAALRVLRRAPDCGVDSMPGTLLTRELVDHGIGAWHDWLADQLGARRRLALWPVFLRPEHGALPTVGITPLSPEALAEAARQVADCIAAGADMTVVDYPPINPLLARLGVPERRLWRCTGGASRLCVQADGTVTPCHPLRWELDRLSPGRVGGTVARALAHADARRMAARGHDGCEECAELALCGSCQAVVWGASGGRFRRDPGCTEALEWLANPRVPRSV